VLQCAEGVVSQAIGRPLRPPANPPQVFELANAWRQANDLKPIVATTPEQLAAASASGNANALEFVAEGDEDGDLADRDGGPPFADSDFEGVGPRQGPTAAASGPGSDDSEGDEKGSDQDISIDAVNSADVEDALAAGGDDGDGYDLPPALPREPPARPTRHFVGAHD
jgi:hypothetical protein